MSSMRFRILVGNHTEGFGPTEKRYSARNPKGELVDDHPDIIKSEIDLTERFGPDKFQRLREDEPDQPHYAAELQEEETEEVDELTTWKVSELREYAEANEIDLEGATRKDEIIAAIRGILPA